MYTLLSSQTFDLFRHYLMYLLFISHVLSRKGCPFYRGVLPTTYVSKAVISKHKPFCGTSHHSIASYKHLLKYFLMWNHATSAFPSHSINTPFNPCIFVLWMQRVKSKIHPSAQGRSKSYGQVQHYCLLRALLHLLLKVYKLSRVSQEKKDGGPD